APSAMLMVDRDRRITLVNQRAGELFGYARDELLGQTTEMLVPERLRSGHAGFVAAFFAEPRARAVGGGRDLFGSRKGGREVPVEIGLNALETLAGLQTLASIIDITARKRDEERFDRLRSQYQDLYEHAPDMYTSVAATGEVTSCNRTFEEKTGYSRDE